MKTLEQKLSRIAVGLALSNLGYGILQTIESEDLPWTGSPSHEMCELGGHLMESDSHEAIFCDEADMWYASLLNGEFRRNLVDDPHYPWVKRIMDDGG